MEKTDINCTISKDGDQTIWKYINLHGYDQSVKCSYELIVEPNKQVYIEVFTDGLEQGVDYVHYSFDKITYNTVNHSSKLALDAEATERHVFWEFVSDGSVEYIGFSIIFFELSKNFLVTCIQRPANFPLRESRVFLRHLKSQVPPPTIF